MKAVLATSTFEQMKITSYEILNSAAKVVEDAEAQRFCEESMRDEEEMALWLEENIEPLTQIYLLREEADASASLARSPSIARRRAAWATNCD